MAPRHRWSRAVAAALAVATVTAGCGDSTGDDELATSATTAPSESAPAGDMPPQHVQNAGPRLRAELSEEDRRAAEDARPAIEAALQEVRTRGAFDEASVRAALEALGHPPDAIQTRAFTRPAALPADEEDPEGVAYGVAVGRAGCVHGDVRPERVLAEVSGRALESGCIAPPTGH